MTELQQKQLAFLNETISYYNSLNRGFDTGTDSCSYVAGCAIGRHIKDKELCAKLDVRTPGEGNDTGVGNGRIFEQLPPELQELGPEFLSHVQSLHDRETNWTIEGISSDGLDYADTIKQTFQLI